MHILPLLAFLLLLIPTFANASLVYNDPEVFWVRQNAAYFTDPATNQAVRTQRLSNEQIRIYLRNDAVRIQLGLEPIEKKTIQRAVSTGPTTLQQYFA
ncbi:MAG TPA: hypothetical protein VJG90_05845, partial [Candidatus Nanoarchaeia archaeon]|nr:hypothetical protein [Candidatus Nanoarchaeia archaeon]